LGVRDKIFEAAETLAKTKPFDRITFAEVAKEAGVHWTAVRRHFGSKEGMRTWLQKKQAAEHGSLADTRTRILEAGQRMFSQLGYANASLDKVAAEAGLTKGAVYWHFSNKQDLFLAILEHCLIQQLRILPAQIEKIFNVNDPEASLTEWFQSQFGFLDNEEGGSMLFLEFVTSSREPEIRAKLHDVHGKILDGVGVLLEEMQRKGLITDAPDPQFISMMIDALMKGLAVEWLIDPGRFQAKRVFQTISNVLWNGLAPRKINESP